MPNAIIDTALISAVVNAVREKGGTTDAITIGDLPQAVADLPSGGGGGNINDILIKLFGTQGSNMFSLTAEDLAGMTVLRTNALRDCYNLKSIELPEGCTSIGSYALQTTKNCEKVIVPSTVTEIGSYGIVAGTSAKKSKLYCLANNPPTITTASIGNAFSAIYVPSASVDAYKSATNWSAKASLIQAIPE